MAPQYTRNIVQNPILKKTIQQDSGKTIAISALFEGGDKADILLNLGRDPGSKSRPLIGINYHPKDGDMEELIIQYR